MSYSNNNTWYRGVRLCSPRNEASNWVQYEFGMKLVLEVKNLWYLVEGTIKTEDGLPVAATVVAADENRFGALLIDSIHEDNIDLLVEATNSKSMWHRLETAHHHTSAGTRYHLL